MRRTITAKFAPCPRCSGNLGREYDDLDGGWDVVCLQCGYRKPIVKGNTNIRLRRKHVLRRAA